MEYADRFLAPEQIDAVDPEVVLSKQPRAFELPSEEERRARWVDFLPEYKKLSP